MLPRSILLAGAVAGAVGPATHAASAQTMRTFSATRPVAGEKLVRATLDFHGGTIAIGSLTGNELFHVLLRYDADRFVPLQEYEPRTGILHLGLQPVGVTGVRVTSRAQLAQTAQFAFNRSVPLMLTANMGASEASLELGDLTLDAVEVRASATRGRVSFASPNRGSCRQATFSVTAGQLEVEHLANAGCYQVRVDGAAGSAVLSFDGSWRRDITLTVDLSMGGLTLRLPKGTGVRLSGSRFLSTLETSGLQKDGDDWISAGYAGAPRKLTVELKTSVAGVSLEWIDR